MSNEAIMEALAVYIFGAILGTTQLALGAYIWHSKRAKTAAEATQITANSFDTLTTTITKMASDFSGTLMKTIDLVNSREARIDELQENNRKLLGDVDEFKKQFSDMAVLGAKQDTEIGLLRDSVKTLKFANGNQANELFDIKEELTKLRLESTQKDEVIKKRDLQIAGMKEIDAKQKERIAELENNRDARIVELETKVSHLEAELVLLKQAATPIEVVTIEVKKDGVNPT